MRRVWCVAAVCMLLLAASTLATLAVPASTEVEAVLGGFTLLEPSIAFSPSTLSFNAVAGSNPPSQVLSIRNPGGNQLNWNVYGPSWMSFSPSSGSFTAQWVSITVSVNVSGLPAAYFVSSVTILAPGTNNSPQVIQVYLTITNPTPTPTPTLTPTPVATPTLTTTPTATPALTATPEATPSLTPAVTPTPAPTAGGSQPSITQQFVVSLMGRETEWRCNREGEVLQDITVVSEDGCITMEIPSGTFALDAQGQPLDGIIVNRLSVHPDAPPGYGVVCAADWEPDGATFNPAFTVRVAVTPEMLSGLDGATMVAAWFNDETGEWEFIGGVYDEATRVFTFSISHFTTFTLLALPGASSTPAVTPIPAEKGTSGIWLIALLVVIGLVLLSFFFFVVLRRRRKKRPAEDQSEEK